ncbi:FecR family protein [Mucilaginibacter sp. Mucisp84]|uniref:FecR family protein n=1 Tax=Mucilaginibacter sp. Mucisp84 TaxID=3243058 RepID=UPI0039A73F2E
MSPLQRMHHLFQKFLDNNCSPQEVEELVNLLREAGEDELDAPMKALWEQTGGGQPVETIDWTRMYKEITAIDTEIESARKPVRRLWPRIAAAASIILALSAGGYFLLHKTDRSPLTAQNSKNDIAPGHEQATLTLANGQKIILRKGLSGVLAQQGRTTVQAGADAITYKNSKVSALTSGGDLEWANTLTTARGEQSPYPLVLADGTKVWLNAESSLTFPADFKGINRTVKVTGEAYFEVVHNAAKPFRVIAGNKTIEDIGTAFDVKAYSDEPDFKTTVLQGAVKLTSKSSSSSERTGGEVMLQPGQQAIIKNSLSLGESRGEAKIITVDPQSAIAWKNGQFRLDEQRLDEIMRQAARWYNVDVVYQDESLKSEAFGGVTARYASVSQLLRALELTNQVQFKIEGRKITVMKK